MIVSNGERSGPHGPLGFVAFEVSLLRKGSQKLPKEQILSVKR